MRDLERLCRRVRTFLGKNGAKPGDTVLVAYSGGPDSTALLLVLRTLAPELGLTISALHVDHALDPDSRRRSRQAAGIARTLKVPLAIERLDPNLVHAHPHGLEAGAREARYRLLDTYARGTKARFIATAHHADDQAETLLQRLVSGSGLSGLGSIAPTRTSGPPSDPMRTPSSTAVSIVRPLLSIRRSALAEVVRHAGLSPSIDPTNADLLRTRNRIRHRLLPALHASDPTIVPKLASLANVARRADRRLLTRLDCLLTPRTIATGPGIEVSRRALDRLPRAFFQSTLRLLHLRSGARYPPPNSACRELLRQWQQGDRLGCDCGNGWRWEGDARWLRLLPRLPTPSRFAYTADVPGVVHVVVLGVTIRIERRDVAAWMFRPSPTRAAFVAHDLPTAGVVVRNRQAGDRIRPLGASGERRLKDVLIDKRYPRHLRDRLPLLCIAGRIVWIPGITIDHRHRIRNEQRVWVAEITDQNDTST